MIQDDRRIDVDEEKRRRGLTPTLGAFGVKGCSRGLHFAADRGGSRDSSSALLHA